MKKLTAQVSDTTMLSSVLKPVTKNTFRRDAKTCSKKVGF
jgi:hypothetical protein